MSLKEAYSLAHTAQCRLQMEASRPERNLRFLVGHLMQYEALRLRIVEIEHDLSVAQSAHARSVAFRGTAHVRDGGDSSAAPGKKPGRGGSGRRSPPPPDVAPLDDEDEDEDEFDDDDDDEGDDDGESEGLGLTRFPSGSARPPRPPPDLVPDDDEDDDDNNNNNNRTPPQDPSPGTLAALFESPAQSDAHQRPDLTVLYNGVRRCHCHAEQDAPILGRMWELPADDDDAAAAKDGEGQVRVTRAVGEVVG